MTKTFIVFSDLHIQPDTVGKVTPVLEGIVKDIVKNRPDYIICLGDVGSFLSQYRFTKDRGGFTVEQETSIVASVLKKCFFKPIEELQSKLVRLHRKRYRPEIIFCLGNHDDSVKVGLRKFLEKYNATVYDFKEVVEREGVYFTHFVADYTGKSPCSSLKTTLTCAGGSVVTGHVHTREVVEARDLKSNIKFAIQLPCATLDRPAWAGQRAAKWDTGWLRLTLNPYHYEFMEVTDV